MLYLIWQRVTIFRVRWFSRWARKEGLSDLALRKAVQEMAMGLYDADLGGNLLKKRIARPGSGKRGGFRTIVATNLKSRWFFIYGFAKNERDNIDEAEEAALKELAARLLAMPPQALSNAVANQELTEIDDGA